jgi:hypothetical protein
MTTTMAESKPEDEPRLFDAQEDGTPVDLAPLHTATTELERLLVQLEQMDLTIEAAAFELDLPTVEGIEECITLGTVKRPKKNAPWVTEQMLEIESLSDQEAAQVGLVGRHRSSAPTLWLEVADGTEPVPAPGAGIVDVEQLGEDQE